MDAIAGATRHNSITTDSDLIMLNSINYYDYILIGLYLVQKKVKRYNLLQWTACKKSGMFCCLTPDSPNWDLILFSSSGFAFLTLFIYLIDLFFLFYLTNGSRTSSSHSFLFNPFRFCAFWSSSSLIQNFIEVIILQATSLQRGFWTLLFFSSFNCLMRLLFKNRKLFSSSTDDSWSLQANNSAE